VVQAVSGVLLLHCTAGNLKKSRVGNEVPFVE